MQRDGITAEHWDRAYGRDRYELSWYELEPTTSLELIDELGVKPEQRVVDIGGGTSSLAARLLDRGFQDVTVLDISTVALTVAKAQLGDRATRVDWLAQDIRSGVQSADSTFGTIAPSSTSSSTPKTSDATSKR